MLQPGLLYFAYGCNMSSGRLAEVLGFSVPPGVGAGLTGWRLDFSKGGEGRKGGSVTATILPDPGCRVYGVVYRIPREALRPLDEFEAAPEHYRQGRIWVEPLGRRAAQAAVTYIAQPRWIVEPGRPDRAYLRLVLEGARQHALPDRYIDWLRDRAAGRAGHCYSRAEDEGAAGSRSGRLER